MKTAKQFAFYALLSICINFLLLACGSGLSIGSFENQSGEINIELPSSINQHLTKTMKIEVRLTVDDKESYTLTIDDTFNTISGTLPAQETGKHTLALDYQIEHNGTSVSIATATFVMTIADEAITQIVLNKFNYTDSDMDGISNIAEINFQTDLFNSIEKPDMNGVHISSSYVLNENITNPATADAARAKHYTVQ